MISLYSLTHVLFLKRAVICLYLWSCFLKCGFWFTSAKKINHNEVISNISFTFILQFYLILPFPFPSVGKTVFLFPTFPSRRCIPELHLLPSCPPCLWSHCPRPFLLCALVLCWTERPRPDRDLHSVVRPGKNPSDTPSSS